jgi:hypothetical protein
VAPAALSGVLGFFSYYLLRLHGVRHRAEPALSGVRGCSRSGRATGTTKRLSPYQRRGFGRCTCVQTHGLPRRRSPISGELGFVARRRTRRTHRFRSAPQRDPLARSRPPRHPARRPGRRPHSRARTTPSGGRARGPAVPVRRQGLRSLPASAPEPSSGRGFRSSRSMTSNTSGPPRRVATTHRYEVTSAASFLSSGAPCATRPIATDWPQSAY